MPRTPDAEIQRLREEVKFLRRGGSLAQVQGFREAAALDPVGARMASCLTPRELQVVGCIADAMQDKAIADRLGVSTETVKRHLVNLRDKLGLDNRLEIAVSVYRRPALLAAVFIPSLEEANDAPVNGG